jgi:hypothetical protein
MFGPTSPGAQPEFDENGEEIKEDIGTFLRKKIQFLKEK